MALPLILMAAGTAISAWSAYQQGQTQANAANDAARMRELEAQEVMSRLNINREAIYRQAEKFKVRQRESIAASGRLTNDSTLSLLEQTNADATREIYNLEKEADFRASSLRAEGGFAQARGNELAQAGQLNAFGTLLTGGYRASEFLGGGKSKPVSSLSGNSSSDISGYSIYSSYGTTKKFANPYSLFDTTFTRNSYFDK